MDKSLYRASELNKVILKMSEDISKAKMMTMSNYSKVFKIEKLVLKH